MQLHRPPVGRFLRPYLKDVGTLENCVNEASVTCKPSDKMQGGSDYTLNCFAGGIVARTDSSWRNVAQNQIQTAAMTAV